MLIFGCHPVYEAPSPHPRFYVKRRPRLGRPVDKNGRKLASNGRLRRECARQDMLFQVFCLGAGGQG